MPSEKGKIKLKWYTLRRVKLTREYAGGLLAGFGGGAAIMSLLVNCDSLRDSWTLIRILGFFLLSLGSFMALYAQDRYTSQ
jgi:hypothetical protein